MTQTSSPHANGIAGLSGVLSFGARVMTTLLLVIVAGIVAIMTAVAGLMLAAAALAMRFSQSRKMQAETAPSESDGMTLEARPTPRGWTVE